MTGPEHYRQAVEILAGHDGDPQRIAAAQVHATLALAAAIGLSAKMQPLDEQAWRDIAATRFAEPVTTKDGYAAGR